MAVQRQRGGVDLLKMVSGITLSLLVRFEPELNLTILYPLVLFSLCSVSRSRMELRPNRTLSWRHYRKGRQGGMAIGFQEGECTSELRNGVVLIDTNIAPPYI